MRKVTLIGLLLLLIIGCGNNQPKEITEVRKLQPETLNVAGNKPSTPPTAMHPDTTENKRFLWELPEGWQEKALTPMRTANFGLADNPAVECYIIVLKGTGGGIVANINRWQRQMGQPELSSEAVAALPVLEMLGQSVSYVEIDGTYQGMTGAAQPDFMMLATACPLADETVFVKMTGPAAAVEAEKENFKAFCTTLHYESAPTS